MNLRDAEEKERLEKSRVFLWDASGTQLLEVLPLSAGDRKAAISAKASAWPTGFTGDYIRGASCEYRLSHAQNAEDRIGAHRTFRFYLKNADENYRSGNADIALAYLDMASEIRGFSSNSEICRRRYQYSGKMKIVGVRNIIPTAEPATDKESSDPAAPSDDFSELIELQLDAYRAELLEKYGGDPFSEYSSKILSGMVSPDGSKILYRLSVSELRRSPAQMEELSVWYALIVFDRSGKSVFREDCWHYENTFSNTAAHSLCFSPDGKYLLFASDGLHWVDLEKGAEADSMKGVFPFVGYTPDGRCIICKDTSNRVTVLDAKRFIPWIQYDLAPDGYDEMYIIDNVSFAVRYFGKFRRFYIDWVYLYS